MNSNQPLLAAVDLGSNSFRLSIGRIVQNGSSAQIYALDRLKETVRLAAGLDEHNRMDQATIDRAVECLKRFGERIEDFPASKVRAVATNTFRIASNIQELLTPAQEALGFPIEIISGQEEARLVYLGVSHEAPPSDDNRLVVDIGGGSTEFIIGSKFTPIALQSMPMGCVAYTSRFFPGGKVTAKAFDKAVITAREEIESFSEEFRHIGWKESFGSSGSAKALVAVLEGTGLSEHGITLEGMLALRKIIIKNGSADTSELKNLKKDRIEVLPAGLAIMLAVFKELDITHMNQGEGALRMGVLYDLMGRRTAEDMREETVRQFKTRYHIDEAQAARIKHLALALFQKAVADRNMDSDTARYLGWACCLHEIGISISRASYHKHTAYVLENADMPGFSSREQHILAELTLAHVGKLSKATIQELNDEQRVALLCFRLATLFMRKRTNLEIPGLALSADGKGIVLSLEKHWLEDNPLTAYSLENEEEQWQSLGFRFKVQTTPPEEPAN